MTKQNKPAIYMTNSQSGKRELFVPSNPDAVSLYVCGVTPYDHAHIGHGRCYLNFDIVYRTLQFMGYQVTYVRNITDVDDKIVKKAAELSSEESLMNRVSQVAQQYSEAFNDDMRALSIFPPQISPAVSNYMPEIIAFIEDLIKKGFAYEVNGSVYFSIASLPSYGDLTHKPLDEMLSGVRVDLDAGKKHSSDFALWKGNIAGALWQSPWGMGRPGWHIECSTFIAHTLGETIDIHGGGQDLLFPHHENECAQSYAKHGKPLARYWLHNAHVTIKSEKMSKSLGNSLRLRDICATYSPDVFRLYVLQHHYRTPIDFNPELLAGMRRAYTRLVKGVGQGKVEYSFCGVDEWLSAWQGDAKGMQLVEALSDDFNTPKALGLIFGWLDDIAKDEAKKALVRQFLQQTLGLSLQPLIEEEAPLSKEIAHLLAAREEARAQKNWAEADRLRDELKAMGYVPQDKKA